MAKLCVYIHSTYRWYVYTWALLWEQTERTRRLEISDKKKNQKMTQGHTPKRLEITDNVKLQEYSVPWGLSPKLSWFF